MAIRITRRTGPSGLADVKVLKSGVRVDMLSEEEDGSLVVAETYDLPLGGVPKDAKSGRYIVILNLDKTQAFLHPAPGRYVMTFAQMGNRTVGASDNSPGLPTNKLTEGGTGRRKDGRTFPIPRRLIFVAHFRIEDGVYKGMSSPATLPYIFQAPTYGRGCDFVGSRREVEQVQKFFLVVGGIDISQEVPFDYDPDPTRLLLRVEGLLQAEGRLFMGEINKSGFVLVDSLSSALPPEAASKRKAKSK